MAKNTQARGRKATPSSHPSPVRQSKTRSPSPMNAPPTVRRSARLAGQPAQFGGLVCNAPPKGLKAENIGRVKTKSESSVPPSKKETAVCGSPDMDKKKVQRNDYEHQEQGPFEGDDGAVLLTCHDKTKREGAQLNEIVRTQQNELMTGNPPKTADDVVAGALETSIPVIEESDLKEPEGAPKKLPSVNGVRVEDDVPRRKRDSMACSSLHVEKPPSQPKDHQAPGENTFEGDDGAVLLTCHDKTKREGAHVSLNVGQNGVPLQHKKAEAAVDRSKQVDDMNADPVKLHSVIEESDRKESEGAPKKLPSVNGVRVKDDVRRRKRDSMACSSLHVEKPPSQPKDHQAPGENASSSDEDDLAEMEKLIDESALESIRGGQVKYEKSFRSFYDNNIGKGLVDHEALMHLPTRSESLIPVMVEMLHTFSMVREAKGLKPEDELYD